MSRQEAPSNTDGLRTAELGFDAAFDRFQEAPGPWPRALEDLDGQSVPFGEPPPGWAELGWAPDGDPRCSYQVSLIGTDDFRVEAWCDQDDDGELYTCTASHTQPTRCEGDDDEFTGRPAAWYWWPGWF